MALLGYMHAPAVGFYFLGSCVFSLCILQKPSEITRERRRGVLLLSSIILLAYIIEVLYYFSRALAEADYEAPESSAIRCLGSILVWSPLTYMLWSSKSLRWHPYFGAFMLQFAIETLTCFLSSFSIPLEERLQNVPLVIECIRAAASLFLMLDGFIIFVTKHVAQEASIDEEHQSLLGEQNGTANGTATANGTTDYGSITLTTLTDDEEAEPADRDKDIKEQQAKRLKEEGGWYGYLKAFAIFLPHLFPMDDWKVMGCLVLRLLYMMHKRVFNLLTPRQLGIVTNKLQEQNGVIPWKDIGLWVLFTYISSYAGLGIIDGLANIVISNSASRRITSLAFKHVLGLSMDFHTSKDSGEVLKAVEQASSLNTLIKTVLFDPKRRDYVEKQRTESSTVNETVHNWQTVAYFNRLTFEHNRYASKITGTIMAQYSYYFRSMGGHAAQDLLTTFGFAGCCIFGMTQIVTGRKPVGNLVTLIMYWHTMTYPLYVLSYSYRHITNSLIGAERLLQLLNTKPSVSDQEGAKDIVVHTGEVEFKDVDFHYDERKPIIKSVNLKAEGGQTIAFVGETGGGKSTMLKLLFRFYDVTGGSIMIDGQDLRSVTQSSLRDALGLVPQDPVLFNQSIRQNIRYAKLEATDAEIEDACRAAAIHDDIVGFPDGYNSKVGERGVRLSGGQLQRIAIVRVILKNPKIVMLDEATSAIDSAIEAQIQEAFRKLSQGRTTFIIAHRLSTIVQADQILVVEKGKIIERGTHQELLKILGGKYCELWTKQTIGHVS
ncbi:hypothetical protein IQ07DRAFT_671450, partial [Pyrenochaeta sp. DS3sAY3a]